MATYRVPLSTEQGTYLETLLRTLGRDRPRVGPISPMPQMSVFSVCLRLLPEELWLVIVVAYHFSGCRWLCRFPCFLNS
jgi:hypothetical protein